ncbi:MAG: hypothetical protein RI967_1397 [Planctomycetota bacterium]
MAHAEEVPSPPGTPSSEADSTRGGTSARIVLHAWSAGVIARREFNDLPAALSAALDRERLDLAWLDIQCAATAECVAAIDHAMTLPPVLVDSLIEGVRRPGADDFEDVAFTTMRAHLSDGSVEFIDFILGSRLVLTIQERVGSPVFDPIEARLASGADLLRRADANVVFLMLARGVCDGYRPVLEAYNASLERFERALVRRPDPSMLGRVHRHRRELLFLRQGLAPLSLALGNVAESMAARGAPHGRLGAMRELQDEVGALLDVVEFQKDSAQHLLDLYLNAASNRLNEIVRVLTIISVIFMPATLIAGIYGMNFDPDSAANMPELRWRFGYPWALGLMLASAAGFLLFFHRKGWLGAPARPSRGSAEGGEQEHAADHGPLAGLVRRRGRARPRRHAANEKPR